LNLFKNKVNSNEPNPKEEKTSLQRTTDLGLSDAENVAATKFTLKDSELFCFMGVLIKDSRKTYN